LTYIFYKKTFDIVPYSEIDALYVQHRLQDREKAALLEDSDSVGDKRDRTGTGAGEGDEPFMPLPLPGSEGNSPVDAETEVFIHIKGKKYKCVHKCIHVYIDIYIYEYVYICVSI
jgi:hypothetical protein